MNPSHLLCSIWQPIRVVWALQMYKYTPCWDPLGHQNTQFLKTEQSRPTGEIYSFILEYYKEILLLYWICPTFFHGEIMCFLIHNTNCTTSVTRHFADPDSRNKKQSTSQMFVGRTIQKVNRWPQNLDEGWISAQSRPHKLSVWIGKKGRDFWIRRSFLRILMKRMRGIWYLWVSSN